MWHLQSTCPAMATSCDVCGGDFITLYRMKLRILFFSFGPKIEQGRHILWSQFVSYLLLYFGNCIKVIQLHHFSCTLQSTMAMLLGWGFVVSNDDFIFKKDKSAKKRFQAPNVPWFSHLTDETTLCHFLGFFLLQKGEWLLITFFGSLLGYSKMTFNFCLPSFHNLNKVRKRGKGIKIFA